MTIRLRQELGKTRPLHVPHHHPGGNVARRAKWREGGGGELIPDDAVIGCTGVLTLGTRGSAGPGEVSVRVRGGSEHFLAWSDEPLPTGAAVLVIESMGSRSVTVIPWHAHDPGPSSG